MAPVARIRRYPRARVAESEELRAMKLTAGDQLLFMRPYLCDPDAQMGHAFGIGLHWIWTIILYTIGTIIVLAIAITAIVSKAVERNQPKRKRYVMRGYGGGSNTTSLHPRQAARGKRIVFIPGVGYRHVQATKPKKQR